MKAASLALSIVAFGWLLTGCGQQASVYRWTLPPGFPEPSVPADNPMTAKKIALGRRLFYDVRLSGNQTQSCASCHLQSHAFAEPARTATGSTGERHHRNTMSLTNVAYNATYTWAHSGIDTIEKQVLLPLFGDAPVEMEAARFAPQILERLAADPTYPREFAEAFGEQRRISFDEIAKSLACFVRSMISFNSPFDRYAYYGNDAALTAAQIRGMNLFMSEQLECTHCHNGFNFSQFVSHESTRIEERTFHNTGLYFLDDPNAAAFDYGLSQVTHEERDRYRFRAPTLRNVARTAPYMHDGSMATLEEVLDFYAAGGRKIESGPYRGDGRLSPGKSPFIRTFRLTPEEKADVIAFLHSLTDEEFLSRPDLSAPEQRIGAR
jgi:cytochrome c peroxidase